MRSVWALAVPAIARSSPTAAPTRIPHMIPELTRYASSVALSDEEARLKKLGIVVISDTDDHGVHSECIRVAQRLRQRGRKIVGLVPASADVAVPPIAVQIGLALVELSGATVALVDANVRWPAFSALAAEE